MFATTIAAWRTSHPLNCPRSRPTRATVTTTIRSLLMGIRHRQRWIDLVDQRTRRRQTLHRQPIRQRNDTPVGPVLRHRDAPPPLDLTHEEQTMPPALRKQHDKALPPQRMERMSDHQ
jgi:hypothetical protein